MAMKCPENAHSPLTRGVTVSGFVTPTETNLHRDALRFMFKTWARHKTTETVLNNGWRLVAVGGGWRLVVPRSCS